MCEFQLDSYDRSRHRTNIAHYRTKARFLTRQTLEPRNQAGRSCLVAAPRHLGRRIVLDRRVTWTICRRLGIAATGHNRLVPRDLWSARRARLVPSSGAPLLLRASAILQPLLAPTFCESTSLIAHAHRRDVDLRPYTAQVAQAMCRLDNVAAARRRTWHGDVRWQGRLRDVSGGRLAVLRGVRNATRSVVVGDPDSPDAMAQAQCSAGVRNALRPLWWCSGVMIRKSR